MWCRGMVRRKDLRNKSRNIIYIFEICDEMLLYGMNGFNEYLNKKYPPKSEIYVKNIHSKNI